MASEHFYLLAPVGQVVEGYLFIATTACSDVPRLRCFADVVEARREELNSLLSIVAEFYGDVYDSAPLFYEQGRGGGGQSSFDKENYLFHPHLCAIPGPLDLHGPLSTCLEQTECADVFAIRDSIQRRPYIFVHTPLDANRPSPALYYAGSQTEEVILRHLRVKQVLAEENGWADRWDWRAYPGDEERVSLIANFNRWYADRYFRLD